MTTWHDDRDSQITGIFGLPPRLPDEGRIAGVCAGIAPKLDKSVRTVRLAFVGLLLMGVGLELYVVLWLLMPGPRRTTE